MLSPKIKPLTDQNALLKFIKRAMPSRRQWRDWGMLSKWGFIAAVLAVVSAIWVLLAQPVIGSFNERGADPRPQTFVDRTESEINIRVRTQAAAAAMAIDFPVIGKIKKIHDSNSPADAVVGSKWINGVNVLTSQNNVEIALSDIRPNRDIAFKILYDPMPTPLEILGTDRWHLSYSWSYGGAIRSHDKWLRISDNREVSPPPVVIRGAVITAGALTPEELKENYEKGPPRTEPP